MKKLIVVVDMQNDFIDGALGTQEAQLMLPKLVKKLEQEKEAELIFTLDTHNQYYMDTQEGKNLPVPHCIKPGHGWKITDDLQKFVDKAAAVIEKPSFGSLVLPQAVSKIEVDEIELVGLCTDICVISNAMILKAAFPEVNLAVDASCCAGVTPESHATALAAMKMCQIEIRN